MSVRGCDTTGEVSQEFRAALQHSATDVLHYWSQSGIIPCVTEPKQFDFFVSGGVEALPRLADDREAQQWHEVTGGSLGDRRVLVRLARDDRGTLRCTGLLVGLDGQEITATNLRTIPVTAIVREVAEYLTVQSPDDGLALMLQELFGAALAPAPKRQPDRPRRGGEGPTDEHLRDFMRHLWRAGGRNQRGAMTRAAREYGIDRATAYRWLPLAAERGITGQEHDQ